MNEATANKIVYLLGVDLSGLLLEAISSKTPAFHGGITPSSGVDGMARSLFSKSITSGEAGGSGSIISRSLS